MHVRTVLLTLATASLMAPAFGEGVSAVKTTDGVRVVWDRPDLKFTVGIPGKKIEPLEHPEHFFLKVDGTPIQIQAAHRDRIFSKPVEISPKGLLLAHRDWEDRNLEKALGAELTPASDLILLADETEALFWSYRMPKGMDAEVVKQLYLTRVAGDHVVVLNGALLKGKKEDELRKTLVAAANRFHAGAAPEGAAEQEKPAGKTEPAAAPAESVPAGRYQFDLNRFGGIHFTVTADTAQVEFFEGDKQGDEITWQAKLAPKGEGTWTTKAGTVFKLVKLPKKVVNDANRGLNSGDWKVTISGDGDEYAEVKKKAPFLAFGDKSKTEYLGSKAE